MEKIAVILVNWNGYVHTLQCINSLRQVQHKGLEIIIIDNGSEAGEVSLLRDLAGITLLEQSQNLGFTGGNNVGIKYAINKGLDAIMLLNNDTTVTPDFLFPLLNELNRQQVAAVQPKIHTMQSANTIWNAGGTFNFFTGKARTIGEGQFDRGQFDELKEVDWITGCCLFAKRQVFEEVGLLDDNFFALCEDVDWSLRAKRKGYQLVYQPASKIFHFEGATAKTTNNKEGVRSPFRLYLNIRNHLFLVRKHVKPVAQPVMFMVHFFRLLIHLAYFTFRGRWLKLNYALKAFKDGLSSYQKVNPKKFL